MTTDASALIASNAVTLRQLQYFAAVAEAASFTRASERLLIAQPALSKQVKELEEALGVELFVRSLRGAHLTDAGRELFLHTRTMLGTLERTIEGVRLTALGGSGRLRLGYYGPSFYNNVITLSALERFRAETPDVEVSSRELFGEQMIVALHERRIDVAISRGDPRAADIDAWTIATERLWVLLPIDDPLANKPTVALADLDGRTLNTFPASLSAGLNVHVADIVARAGISLATGAEVTQLLSFGYHVGRDGGIAILPASSANIVLPNVVSREISDAYATADLVAWSNKGDASPQALRFLRLLGVPPEVA